MGFMDKFKDAAQQAQDAAKAAGGSVASMGGMGGAADTAAKTNKIAQQKIGGEIVVNVDPDHPKSMLLWG